MADYSGYTISQLYELPVGAFLLIKRDSWTNSMKQSEEGLEILKRIYQLQQSAPDIGAIRKFTQGKG